MKEDCLAYPCFDKRIAYVQVLAKAMLVAIVLFILFFEVLYFFYMQEKVRVIDLLTAEQLSQSMQNYTQSLMVYVYGVGALIVLLSWFIAFFFERRKNMREYLFMLSNAVQYSGEAIAIVDVNGLIQYVNPAFTALTGYAAHEAIGQPALDLLSSPAQSEKQFNEVLDMLKRGEAWHGKLVNKKKDGRFYPVSTSISPVRNVKGVVTHYVVLQNDETLSQKLHEKEIQEEKMKSLATAVGGIAHEFNNILTGIMGTAFLMKLKEQDQDLKDKLETIEELGEKAAAMVQQMLVYVGHELQAHTHVYINLNKLVQASVNVFNQETGMHCQFQACKNDVMIKGDVATLSDAVMQILRNAKDAVAQVESPEVVVNVEVMHADAAIQYHPNTAKAYACIRIMDNGPKVPQEIKEAIFEPFFTTKDVGKGTGLGLSAVYGIAKEHHGFVTLDDSCNLGCTFLLCIPIHQEGDDTTFMGEAL
ncbi:two-component system sensor histidine kinase NtrB [Ghiorsea bivora]|uniref:two-component system sensor histidine kinase NtrB n=1 Tax=Ghiorsea bivora TaxID=1485545 RepID=UPI000571676F|nr:PAS domain-containing protein [Ghiorsea bivora]